MRAPPSNIAGRSRAERRQWNTYVYWSRATFPERLPSELKISRPRARLAAQHQRSLQAILFTAFALEYRLRNVYDVLGLTYRRRDGLWELASNLEVRARSTLGLNGQPVRFTTEWQRVLPRIQKLLESRNTIAHGNALKVRELIVAKKPSIKIRARRDYNAFIDAVRVINIAIGYEHRRGKALQDYYAALKVRRG